MPASDLVYGHGEQWPLTSGKWLIWHQDEVLQGHLKIDGCVNTEKLIKKIDNCQKRVNTIWKTAYYQMMVYV